MMQKCNKMISVILTLIIVFSAFFNNFSFSVSADEWIFAYVTGSGVRVRTTPQITDDNIIEKISTRQVTYLSKTDVANANGVTETWYQITYHNGSNQITGYVHGDYVKITTYNPDAAFEEKLLAFPESYRDSLRALKTLYPKWEFIPEPVDMVFNNAVYEESLNMRKQVSFTSQPVSWRNMGQGSYDWNKSEWITSNGGWTGASREIIAYYMDPRNFLNDTYVYQFLNQSYNSATQTEQGLSEVISGTFLADDYPTDASDPYAYIDSSGAYKGSYKRIIIDAAIESNISPYIIASKIIQEQGVSGTSSLISGTYSESDGIYLNYYNFFNIGAYGSNNTEVICNGLNRASKEGWNTRALSIRGGAKFLAQNYIAVGQDTYYYQDFNVKNPDKLYHQYAQAVHDASNKGKKLAETYKDKYDCVLDFKIPIFLEMPDSASVLPESSGKKNNYYASAINAVGLTPSFNMYSYNYDLHVTGDTTIYVTPVSGASVSTAKEYNLKQGANTISIGILSETGFSNHYQINIQADVDCVLKINETNESNKLTVMKGDTNGDNVISLSDLANIRLHLLGLFALSGDFLIAADTNNDNTISLSDLANVRLHLLGLYTIK